MASEVISMYCPNCSYPCEEQDRFCSHCGKPLQAPPIEMPVVQRTKRGSHWAPVLIMIIMAVVGTVIFFTVPYVQPNPPAQLESSESDSCFYLIDGILYFYPDHYDGPSELVVPNQIDGQDVLGLSVGCFIDCDKLTTVILPGTLGFIDSSAFEGCTSLRGIYIPESVTYIGDDAFLDCKNLEAIYLHDSLETIGHRAFSGCDNLWYIMYEGSHRNWIKLYDEFVTPYTGVYCDDGSFYQGESPKG